MPRLLRDWTDSDKVHKLTAEAERFFTRLIMKVDDFGRYYANTKLLKSSLFPLHTLKCDKIEKWLIECENAELILRYEVDGKKYLEIKMFDQKLKVRRSKYPPSNEEDRISLREGYVYIIGTSYDKPVKIGFSVNPWSRLREISGSHPDKLELLLTMKSDKDCESLLHKELKKLRIKNEWFMLNNDIINCLTKYSNDEISKDNMLVEIRSISSLLRTPLEYEVEVEVEKKRKEGKGIPADAGSPQKEKAGMDIQAKQKLFMQELSPFVEKYGKAMVRKFYDYWSEPNKSSTKIRMEMEKTWELPRRLERWASNNFDGQKVNSNQNQSTISVV